MAAGGIALVGRVERSATRRVLRLL